MTDRQKAQVTRVAKVVAFAVASAPTAVVAIFWALNTAFVSEAEFQPVTETVSRLDVQAARDSATLDRIVCYLQAQAGERPHSECIRPEARR